MIQLGISLKVSEGGALLEDSDRFRHCYLIGKTRTGKSTLFLNLIAQELYHAHIILDPAGNFAEAVAAIAPPDRLVYVDKNHPFTINPLRRKATRSEIANQFIEVVNNCVTGSTPSIEMTVLMGEIVRNAINALPEKHLEIDYLSNFLNYEHIRDNYREHGYWKHFDDKDKKGWYVHREKRDSAQRVSARLSAFILDENLKNFTIGQNQFEVDNIVKEKKIVCFNLKGFDDDLMLYIGNLVTTAVKSYYRHEATTDSEPLFFYVDEFQLFLSPAFNNMLAECGKYNISVNLAHQSFLQTNPKTLNIVLGNAYTKIAFNVGSEEAEQLSKDYQVKQSEFLNLKKYQALALIGNKVHHIMTFPPLDTAEFNPPKTYNFLADEKTSWICYT